MVRVSNHRDQQLKKDIQPYIKKYYDYTYQKLVEVEEIIRGNINNMSSEIKTIEFNIKDVNKNLSKASELLSDASARMNKEEQEAQNNIISSGKFPYPKDPLHPIFNGRNLVCIAISILGFGLLSEAYGKDAFIFVPGIFILSIFVVSRILKDSDDQMNREYSTKVLSLIHI